MEKKYKEIDFLAGSSIEEAVNELLDYKYKKILARGSFNGIMLYSDTVEMDNAYLAITGRTKNQLEIEQRKLKEDYERSEKEHASSIPILTDIWIKKGHEILEENKWNDWDKIVPIRLKDLYHGMELECCLDIIKELNDGTFEKAKELIEKQNHSGTSFALVCSLVKKFSNYGDIFVSFINEN